MPATKSCANWKAGHSAQANRGLEFRAGQRPSLRTRPCATQPALAAGCTVILKPSEIAPLSSMLLAEMLHEAGFPKGVFNLVNGDGAETGEALTGHPDIDMISFTGSTRAGALISQNAAKDFKRISLELGGKGANIIFKDAGPDAIAWSVLRCFRNSGQSCNAPTRMLVEISI